jgi:hypothetical protein
MKPKVITWRDSTMHITQETRDTKWEVQIITSVGFVIYEDKKIIVLAGDTLGEDVRRVIVIPKENII